MLSAQLPIGVDDFGKLITQQYLCVDKTLLIKELLDSPAEVILLPRPRRFGKTINLSMLQHFFAKEVYGLETAPLFHGLKISTAGERYMAHQGQYPVIFISFKDIKSKTFSKAYNLIKKLLANLYKAHRYLLDNDILSTEERAIFNNILKCNAAEVHLRNALYDLSEYLCRNSQNRTLILIDEYDAPIHAAYESNYYDDMIQFMRGFLGAALKTNRFLSRGVMTGILRISKESIFSDLNNIAVYSTLKTSFSSHFGFTDAEVQELLQNTNLTEKATDIRRWYNGYIFGNNTVYNPWSIVYCLNSAGKCEPYWVNTSQNSLIKDLLARASSQVKEFLLQLMSNQTVSLPLAENFSFAELSHHDAMLWSLLVSSGYLTCQQIELSEGIDYQVQATIPNEEIQRLYHSMVLKWFDGQTTRQYPTYLQALLAGHIPDFTYHLTELLKDMASYFDTGKNHPEKFYHGFILGLLVLLKGSHSVTSNRESGYGRYDVFIVPQNKNELGFILEFKTIWDANTELTFAANEALAQIETRQYETELRALGITRIIKMGLAFHGKKVAIASTMVS